ncbi:hypothetical protein JMK10_20900, partial [Rhodovulum sulfidophilum]
MTTLFGALFPPSGWRTYLPRRFVLILTFCLTGNAAMADVPNRQHYLDFDMQGAVWVLRVNGVDLWTQADNALYSSSLPINDLLKKGENSLSLIYLPMRRLDPETRSPVLEHHRGFKAEVRLQAIEPQGGREEIHLLSVGYDENGDIIRLTSPVSGSGFISETSHLATADGQVGSWFPVSKSPQIVNAGGQSAPAETLTARFTVDDDLPGDFFWEDKAVPLQDTREMRAGLRRAYQDFYKLVEQGRGYEILELARPLWARAGTTLAGGKSAEDYIGGKDGLRRFSRNPGD